MIFSSCIQNFNVFKLVEYDNFIYIFVALLHKSIKFIAHVQTYVYIP